MDKLLSVHFEKTERRMKKPLRGLLPVIMTMFNAETFWSVAVHWVLLQIFDVREPDF